MLVVKDPDTGEIIRERVKDSDAIAIYKVTTTTMTIDVGDDDD